MFKTFYQAHDGKVFDRAIGVTNYEVQHLGRDKIRMYDLEGKEVYDCRDAVFFLVGSTEAGNLVEDFGAAFGTDNMDEAYTEKGVFDLDIWTNYGRFFSDEEIFEEGCEFPGDINRAIYDEGFLN